MEQSFEKDTLEVASPYEPEANRISAVHEKLNRQTGNTDKDKWSPRSTTLRTKGIRFFEKMISRYQVICALLLLGAVLFYKTMAQVDGYTPGVDYPIYNSVPFGLTFTCGGKLPGYYADPEARCQVWHWCLPNGRQFSFLCPNGTVFSQTTRVCDWWFKVDCNDSPRLYGNNDELYRDVNGNKI